MSDIDQNIKKAGFLLRSLAFFIDIIILFIIAILLSTNIGWFFRERASVTVYTKGTLWRGIIPLVVSFYGHYIYCFPFAGILTFLPELFGAQTIGKMILKFNFNQSCKIPIRCFS